MAFSTAIDFWEGTYSAYTILFAVISLLILFVRSKGIRHPNGFPTPPGPHGFPFFGMLFERPIEKEWITYAEWSKTYGDMIYFKILGQGFLVLNSMHRINDLLDKRSSIYSDRPQSTMLMELMDWRFNLGLQSYGPWWRQHRRLFHEHFHKTKADTYRPIQVRETKRLLQRLLVTPEDFVHHIRHTFAATVMDVTYGITIQETNDVFISTAEAAMEGIVVAGVPGAFLVDFVPLLKYVPPWFPGASFKRKAMRWRQINQELKERPFMQVQREIKNGTAKPSVATSLIGNLPSAEDPKFEYERSIAMNVPALAYVAGADTTFSSIQTFFLAMALYPEVQRKAQTELDRVIGKARLAEFSDRSELPYLNALIKEVTRWNIVLPLLVPHMTTSDDLYDGYFIPAGTIVFGNAWAVLHNPADFPDPKTFRPERFLTGNALNPDIIDPTNVVFGFGRRICAGRYLAHNSLYSIISSILALYDIKPQLNSHGESIDIQAEFTTGLLTYPEPFKCSIKPRSPEAEALIRGF